MIQTSADRAAVAPEIIAIASQKGGVGKSTTALNLSVGLVAAGRTVLLIDLDPNGHAGDTLISGAASGGGTERLLRDATLTRDMITATEIPDLFLVSGGSGLGNLEAELALVGDSRTRLRQAFAGRVALPLHFDHVVLDCPPGVGLLTINAFAVAHKILLPVLADPAVLEALPTLLKTISRLRAGLKQPFHALHLLVVQRVASTSVEMLIKSLRRDYGQLMLLTEIPSSDKVREAAERGRPLLAHCPQCDVSQAYVELAAEWLLKQQERPEKAGLGLGLSFRARKDFIASQRDAMNQHVQAWLMDPSSLLYDESWENERHQDTLVFDHLFQAESTKRPWALLLLPAVLVVLLTVIGMQFWLPSSLPWGQMASGLSDRIPPAPQLAALETTRAVALAPEAKRPASGQDFSAGAIEQAANSDSAEQALASTLAAEPVEMANPVESPLEPLLDQVPPVSVAPAPLAQAGDDVSVQAGWGEIKSPKNSVPPLATQDSKLRVTMEIVQPPASDLREPPADAAAGDRSAQVRWQVQVLAGRSLERVRRDGQHILTKFGALLGNRKLVITYPDADGSGDGYYRLRVFDWDTQNEANSWCWGLRRLGQHCFVVPAVRGQH